LIGTERTPAPIEMYPLTGKYQGKRTLTSFRGNLRDEGDCAGRVTGRDDRGCTLSIGSSQEDGDRFRNLSGAGRTHIHFSSRELARRRRFRPNAMASDDPARKLLIGSSQENGGRFRILSGAGRTPAPLKIIPRKDSSQEIHPAAIFSRRTCEMKVIARAELGLIHP
jgi:hypothetical protein